MKIKGNFLLIIDSFFGLPHSSTLQSFGRGRKLYFTMTSNDSIALKGAETFISLVLSERIKISPDTFIFRFALPSVGHKLGLPIGQNIQVRASINGEEVIRAYTPVSSDDDLGHMDLLIKVYFKNVHPNFPNGGLMSQYIHELDVGQTLDIRGPTGRLVIEIKKKIIFI